MLIHFIASRSTLEHDIKYYRMILDAVRKEGHTFTSDWLEHAYELARTGEGFEQLDWNSIYRSDMESLAKTDLVIADVTSKSFAVGFQVAVALQHKKPTLLLKREEEGDGQQSYYPMAAKDNLLVHRTYNVDNIEKIVEDFIKENRIDNKDLRFNFFIDRQIYNYLRWASFKTGKTKAEILRELVQREIKEREY